MELNEKQTRLGNRLSGLAMMVFGGITGTALPPIGALLIAEGTGDLIWGDHHYLSSSIISYATKGEVQIEYQFDEHKYFITR